MTTDSIRARFNGEDITLRIHRDDLGIFEHLHGSAFELYQKIAAGRWVTDDLKAIIRQAIAPRRSVGKPQEFRLEHALLEQALNRVRGTAKPPASSLDGATEKVNAAFLANGPAVYASLAQLVLGAAVFGIDEKDAHYTDELAHA